MSDMTGNAGISADSAEDGRGSLIRRSIALTSHADEALEHLAEVEDTSRSDLIREALSLLFASRGIALDARDGVAVNPVAVVNKRNQRKAPTGDAVREAFSDWWTEHRETLMADARDPEMLDLVTGCLLEHVDRDGIVRDTPERILAPGHGLDRSPGARTRWRVSMAVGELVEAGGVEIRRLGRKRDLAYRPAPWVA